MKFNLANTPPTHEMPTWLKNSLREAFLQKDVHAIKMQTEKWLAGKYIDLP